MKKRRKIALKIKSVCCYTGQFWQKSTNEKEDNPVTTSGLICTLIKPG